ncbi:hypothetical protein D3C83_164430 [compost metagenome]
MWPCAKRPIWYGMKPPPCAHRMRNFFRSSSAPLNMRCAIMSVVSSGKPMKLRR